MQIFEAFESEPSTPYTDAEYYLFIACLLTDIGEVEWYKKVIQKFDDELWNDYELHDHLFYAGRIFIDDVSYCAFVWIALCFWYSSDKWFWSRWIILYLCGNMRITANEYDKKIQKLKTRRVRYLWTTQESFFISSSYVLELVNRAHMLFKGSQISEKKMRTYKFYICELGSRW